MRALAPLLLAVACAAQEDRPARSAPAERPLFSFGVVADVQYADKDTRGTRRYREADGKLARCVADWNRREPTFAVQLGDLVDGHADVERSVEDLDRVLAVLAELEHPIHHVIGNHCLSVPRRTLMARLGMERAWYDFAVQGWRFVVLDGMDVNVLENDPSPGERRRVRKFLDARPEVRERLAAVYNGGIGERQLAWLGKTLAAADVADERVIVLCHLPVLAEAADPGLLAWNHGEVAAILERHPSVQAFFSGHHHAGGYAARYRVHHVTFPALCDAPEGGNAYGVVEVYEDRLEIRGAGTVPGRTLRLRANRLEVRIVCDEPGKQQPDGSLTGHRVHWEIRGRKLDRDGLAGELASLAETLPRVEDEKSGRTRLPGVIVIPSRETVYLDVAITVEAVLEAGFTEILFGGGLARREGPVEVVGAEKARPPEEAGNPPGGGGLRLPEGPRYAIPDDPPRTLDCTYSEALGCVEVETVGRRKLRVTARARGRERVQELDLELLPQGARIRAGRVAPFMEDGLALGLVVERRATSSYHFLGTAKVRFDAGPVGADGLRDLYGAWMLSDAIFTSTGEPYRVVEVHNTGGDSIEITFRRGRARAGKGVASALDEKIFVDTCPVFAEPLQEGRSALLEVAPRAPR